MSVTIRDNEGKPILEIGDFMIQSPMIDGKFQPYGGHWINRADEKLYGEGLFCPADKLVKLLNDFYDKEF